MPKKCLVVLDVMQCLEELISMKGFPRDLSNACNQTDQVIRISFRKYSVPMLGRIPDVKTIFFILASTILYHIFDYDS